MRATMIHRVLFAVVGTLACFLPEKAIAQGIPELPARVNSATCWPSGDSVVGATEPLSPSDLAAESDVEDFVQGNLDIRNLESGTHRIPVRIKDAKGIDGELFWVDVVIFEPLWEPSQPGVDMDSDGLPDQWEREHFGSLDELAEADSDKDGLSNLDELRLGSDPADSLLPGNRLMGAEVFIDEDPGEGRAFPMAAVDGLLEGTVEEIELPNYLTRYLNPGHHIAGIRVQRETGQWSEVRQVDIVVFEDCSPNPPEDFGIVEAEGFWEDLITPGAGTELALEAKTGGNDVRDLANGATIGTAGQSQGLNHAFCRFRSGKTGYGVAHESFVAVQDPDPLVDDVPFFVDSLFGVANDFGMGSELMGQDFGLRSPWWMMQEPFIERFDNSGGADATVVGSSLSGDTSKPTVGYLNEILSGTVIGTSGSYYELGNTNVRVFDRALETFYDSANASGEWVGLDLGSKQSISLISFCPRAGWASRMVGGLFQASNDVNFSSGVVTLYTVGSIPPEGVMTEQAISDPGCYRYVRYIGPSDAYCNVAEVKFYTSVPLDDSSGWSSGGLLGQYFGNSTLSETPSHERIDSSIDFGWGSGGPFEGMSDYFSVRWTGYIVPDRTGSYTFQVTGDDGVRLWINDAKMIDGWVGQVPTTYTSRSIFLTAGTTYPVTMEYFENSGGALSRLNWKGPQDAGFKVIPSNSLYTSGCGVTSVLPEMPLLGWIGTGDASAYGIGNSLDVNLQTGGTLTWLWGDATFAVAFQDDQGLGSGKGLLSRYGMVTSSVPEIVHVNPDTRLVSIGWQATGAAPANGTTNSVTYRLTRDTSIRWLWKTQHRVRIETRHGDVEGWEEWYDAGSETSLVPRAHHGYEFDSWGSGINGSSIPGVVTVNAPIVVEAVFRPTQAVQLTVVQIDGSRATTSHVKGEVIDLSPTVPKVENGNTRDVATGWRAEGAIYDSGSGINATLALTRDTTLCWLPTRQYRIQPVVIPQGAGTIRVEGRQSTSEPEWYDAGPIRLVAKHTAGNRFVDWYLQKWNQSQVSTILSSELPLVARFGKVEPLGDFVPVDGGALTSPNSAVSLFRSYIPSAKMKRTEVTTSEYCTYLNWALQAGYIETPNQISVRGANPLAEYTEGLKAEWFRGEDWTVEPEFRNIVSSLNLDFGAGSPSQITNGTPNCPFTETDYFSFRLRGQIYSSRTGKISLKEFCDEKVKIIFRGAVVLDNTDPNTNGTVQVNAVTGWNDVEFVFVELTGLAKFKVQWDPNGSTAWQDVPSGVLRHKRLADSWASKISTFGAGGFHEDLELVDFDTADCNIEMVSGVYQPKTGQENYPLVDVTWHGAVAYCQWLADATGQPVTLPDEWLWEYAASGGNSSATGKYYPWGPLFLGATHNSANYAGVLAGSPDVYDGISPVGIFPAYQGLRDMAGNVFEWTSTRYEQGDPVDPFMVLRGGSWNQPSSLMPNSYRLVYKNQYYSDKATGFRPAVVNKVDFSVPGYVEVPTIPAVVSPNSTRGDYTAPSERYQMAALEVTNSEYARFLNESLAVSGLIVESGWVKGGSTSGYSGKRLMALVTDGGIESRNGVFVAVPGKELQPVTSVTWYGADAYCRHLSELAPSVRFGLSDQWQWESAMLRGLDALDSAKVNFSLKNLGVTKSGSFGPDVRYGTGFWPGFYDGAGNVQEWTSSPPATGMTDRAVVRGGAFNLDSMFTTFTKADQHAGLEEASPNLGFRVSITAMAPKVEGLYEKVVVPASSTARKLAFTANSYRKNPVWAWQKVSGPGWISMSDLGSGRCQVIVTPPSSVEDAVAVFSVNDGILTTFFSVSASVVTGGSFQIEGLPDAVAMRDGNEATVLYVRAIPSGVTGNSVTWSATGGEGKVTVESTGALTAKLTVQSGITGTMNLVLTASDGALAGTAACILKGATPALEFVDFPETLVFDDNRTSVRVPLEVKGGAVSGGGGWSVGGASSSWARIISQSGASAILEIDRTGFTNTGTIAIAYTDGVSSLNRDIRIEETPSAPRVLLPASSMQFVAGTEKARILVTAEDRNAGDVLTWSVEPGDGPVSIVPVNGRSAELVVNATTPFADTAFTVRASDGGLAGTGVIHFSVINGSPVIVGPEGLQEFTVGSGVHELVFSVTDADRGQNPRIEVLGAAPWFSSRVDGKNAVRISIPTGSATDGSFTISATDGLATVTRIVPVKVRKINGTPGINGLPGKLQLARFSAPVRLPFTLTDNDESDSLSLSLVFPVEGVRIVMDGARIGRLMIDPVQAEEAVPLLLEVTDGKEKIREHLQLMIGDSSPDAHQIAQAEYFFDAEPVPGSGIPMPASNNEPYCDAATYERLAPVASTLEAGWHRIGMRFRTSGGSWSTTRWLDLHVYDDAGSKGLSLTRPDGDLAYSRWPTVNPVAGNIGDVPDWSGSFSDLDPGQGAGSQDDQVFEDNDGIEAIETAIVWSEYFIDSDPGQGHAARLPMDRRDLDSSLAQIQFDLDTSNLAVGLHQIGLRCRMADGTWGDTTTLSFYVFEDFVPTLAPKAEVVDAEYIWNNSGSPGFGYGLPLSQASSRTEIGVIDSQPVQTASLDTGDQNLNVRFKNQDDQWGETRRWGITVAAPDGALNLANLHVESNLGVVFLNYDSWQSVGSTVFLHVPQLYWVNELVYANFGYIGQGSVPSYGEGNSVSFVMNGPSDLTWIWGRDCEVVSNSSFGAVSGSSKWQWFDEYKAGYGVFLPLEQVALSVPEAVSVSPGTRQHCIGWTGSGSAPATGKGNQVNFTTIAKSSAVDWVWKKEHALTIEVVGEGQVFGNDGWIADGAVENISAVPNPGHRFVRWELAGSGNNATIPVLMDGPKTVRAVFSQYRVWSVDPVSKERLLAGVYEDGAQVSLDHAQFVDLGTGSRYVVTGWSGAGSATQGGTGLNASFTIHSDSEIRWYGVKQHWVGQRVNEPSLGSILVTGSRVVAESSWYDEGVVTIEALPGTDSVFARWLSDLDGAPRKIEFELRSEMDAAAVFRRSSGSLDLADVPAGIVVSSPNSGIEGFQSEVSEFKISRTETKTADMVAQLNLAWAERSIRMSGSKVLARREISRRSPGMLLSWLDSAGVTLKRESVLDADGVQIRKPSGYTNAVRCKLEGELYRDAKSLQAGLLIEGAGTVKVLWNGNTLASSKTLPAWISLGAAMGWGNLQVEYTTNSQDDFMSARLTDSSSVALGKLAGTSLRHVDPDGAEPISLVRGFVGASASSANGFSRQVVSDGTLSLDPALGGFWFKDCGGDFDMQVTVARPSSGSCGLMVRHGLRADSPKTTISVHADGRLGVNGSPNGTSSRSSWTLRMSRRGVTVITEFLDLDGKWKDATNGTLELKTFELFAGRAEMPAVAGVLSDSATASFTGLQFHDLSRRFNREGQILLDLGWPGSTIGFDGTAFSAVPNSGNLPVVCVTHDGALQYAEWLEDRLQDGDYDLPTEWEFEYLSGGRIHEAYPWGLGADSAAYANLAGSEPLFSQERMAPVGSYAAVNGIYDLAGNAWEWTSSDQIAGHGAWKNIRGGSFRQPVESSAASFRLFYGREDFASNEVGFRVVRRDPSQIALGRVVDGGSLNLASPSDGIVRGFGSPGSAFAFGSVEVSNADYCGFLNALSGAGKLNIVDGWAVSGSSQLYGGMRLLMLSGNPGIMRSEGVFKPVAGKAGQPVTMVSWYGADAFGRWLTDHSADWLFRLPTEWEWETAASSGYVGTSGVLSTLQIANQKGVGDALLDGSNQSWSIGGMLSSVAEWTGTEAVGMPGLMAIRGGAAHWYSGAVDPTSRVEYLDAAAAASHVGFRLVRVAKESWESVSEDSAISASIETGVLEEGGTGQLILTRSGDPSFELSLAIACGDPRVHLPSTIVFAPGESVRIVDFDIGLDPGAQGDASSTVSIISEFGSTATLSLLVKDASSLALSMNLSDRDLDPNETATLRIVRNGDTGRALTVRLGGAGATAFSLPSSIQIPAGSAYVEVNVTAPRITQSKLLSIQAAADWYAFSTDSVQVNADTSIATLANMTLSSGTLSPAFDASTTSYVVSVPNAVSSLTVSPSATDGMAVVKVNGASLASGGVSAPIPLSVGTNTISVLVTAQDGVSTQTYTVTVTRAASAVATLSNLALSSGTLSPTFASATISYAANVPNLVTSITVTPTLTDGTASVKVNGTTVASGSASASIPLSVGNNTITTLVNAQDGVTTQTYTVTVTRAASAVATLSNLALSSGTLSPTFVAGTTVYTASVANAVSSLTVTPTLTDSTASVKVNGATVASGAASASIPLIVGNNTITTLVTAQDGTTSKTYTVTVIRAASAVATLSNLALSSGTLSPTFASATTTYSASVGNAVSSITVTPTLTDSTASVKVNGTTVVYDSASAAIPLSVGTNTITTLVTAQDGTTTKSYTVTVTRAASTVATLSNLALSSGTLSPTFAAGTTVYTASVANAVTSLTVTPTLTDSTASVKVNGTTVDSGSASASIPLSVGNNTITTLVTAQDGVTTQTYTLTITRPPSAVATLSNLTLSSGTLSPTFASATTTYSASVANAVTSITVTPMLTDTTAIVKVNGVTVASGTASASIPLSVGTNSITTLVTAQDGTTTKTYTVTVTRAASAVSTLTNLVLSSGTLSPTFAAGTINYTASVANNVTALTVTPTLTDSTASVKVNGAPVASGSASASIPLSVGNNTITTLVTAQDGTTTKTYTVTVTRAASAVTTLSNLALSSGTLSPAFASATTTYTANVANAVTSLTVTPTLTDSTASVKVNGTTVVSGSASSSIPLIVGNNTITTLVTAQDGVTTQTYTVTVTRASSAVATLSNLALSSGTLSPTFVAGTTVYTASVANTVSSLTVTPTLTDTTAIVKVNGATVASGAASASIPLSVGNNTITTLVTAQDGVTTQTYTVTVTRPPSAVATLSNLVLSSGTLSPTFAAGTTVYTASVANAVSSITVTPTLTDTTAALKVNGATVASGSASATIPLSVGNNTITTLVTAQDGVTTQTYTLTITRPPSAVATLSNLTLSSGALSPTFASPTTTYSASVANAVTSITVTPTLTDTTAMVKVNGTTVASGTASAALPLNVGANTITIFATAQDGTTTKTYTVTVTRAASAVSTLTNLVLSSGTLNPVFVSDTISYTASVANNVTSLTVTPTLTDSTASVKVNGTAVASGSASASIPLSVGANTITTLVTAQDGTTSKTYTVTVTRAASTVATLSNLALSSGTLSPAFASATTTYTANVANAVTSLTVTPTLTDSTASVKVNGLTVTSGTASVSIPLIVGNNTITTLVTAQDGTTTKTYTVTVARAASAVATLSNLALSSGTLSPTFASATTTYSASVANAVTSITVTPTLADSTASVKVNGATVASGSASSSIPLSVGNNTITTLVTAQDGVTTQTYTVTVTRPPSAVATLSNLVLSSGTLSPTFASVTTAYSASVANAVGSITVTPTLTDTTAMVKVNGTTVASGTASAALPLNVGANTITIFVTGQDGTTTKTYTVTVTRAASAVSTLTNLVLSSGTLSPTFAAGTINYTASVANNVTALTVTPTLTDSTASVKVNGTTVASGTASASIPLSVGTNTITALVTAQNGIITKTYTVTVTRAASAVATLSNLALSSGTLSPTFASATTTYSANVANAVSSITVTPTLADGTASVKVNGVTVASGSASAAIPLIVGSNTITTVVTAQDGVTTQTYTVTVTRPPSAVATLSNLVLSSGTLSPTFASATTTYSTSVANAVGSITVTPTLTDTTAIVKVNGTTVASGSTSSSIPLNVGTNTITTLVTAQDGVTTQTYILTITRAPSAIATLSNLETSAGSLSPAFNPGVTSYEVSAANTTTSATVTPTLTDTTAVVRVNGTLVESGTSSTSIPLVVGANAVDVRVTAQDGTTILAYTLTITRAPSAIATLSGLSLSSGTLSPVFSASTTSYTAAVANSVSSLKVTPKLTDTTASVKVNGILTASGTASTSIPLIVGTNTISVLVTAQDGTTTKTYTVKVTRAKSSDATLSGLVVKTATLSPVFKPAKTTYSATVASSVKSVKIKPTATSTAATIKVNGTAVASGTLSKALPLDSGKNLIKILVTAQDGTTKTYKITITRGTSAKSALAEKPLETLASKVTVEGLRYQQLSVVKPTPGFSCVIEVSPDLVNWSSGDRHTTIVRDDDRVQIVRDNTPVKPGSKRFIRVRP